MKPSDGSYFSHVMNSIFEQLDLPHIFLRKKSYTPSRPLRNEVIFSHNRSTTRNNHQRYLSLGNEKNKGNLECVCVWFLQQGIHWVGSLGRCGIPRAHLSRDPTPQSPPPKGSHTFQDIPHERSHTSQGIPAEGRPTLQKEDLGLAG